MALIKVLISAVISFGLVSFANAETKSAKAKPAAKKPYKLTPEEEKIVKDAKAAFKKAEKAPPPSKHMQDKMQSSVGDK